MRYFIFLISLLGFCCNNAPEQKGLHHTMTGNWFVLYHQETVMSEKQEQLYESVDDSLELLKNLKLISFSEKGGFKQMDDITAKGRWGTKDETMVSVHDGGKGFENFRAGFERFDGNMLELEEEIRIEGEKIKLTWHLLKIEEGQALDLFDEEKNKWRAKARAAETEEGIKQRLSAMLKYYSVYFNLIADKSSYFIPARVPMPLRFYQHAIGIKAFDKESEFAAFFYSPEQAERAFYILKDAINKSKFDFPEKDSYSEEYSLMLNIMAEQVLR